MNSKNKGNRFERKIAGFFTKWTGYKFERNRAGSGAWHSNKDSTSDLTCTDERHAHRCKISIECKNYKEIKFEHLLLGNKGCDILKFWEQASKDAKRANNCSGLLPCPLPPISLGVEILTEKDPSGK